MEEVSCIQSTSVFAFKSDNGQPSEFYLGAVLRPEPRHDLDAVRHDRNVDYPKPIMRAESTKPRSRGVVEVES